MSLLVPSTEYHGKKFLGYSGGSLAVVSDGAESTA